jgi:hypothetical protein
LARALSEPQTKALLMMDCLCNGLILNKVDKIKNTKYEKIIIHSDGYFGPCNLVGTANGHYDHISGEL